MPIRPIDMQVAIPKLSEVSRMSHLEQQKAGLQQDQQALSGDRSKQKASNSVMQSQKDAKSDTEADARKKGRNQYTNNNGNKKNKRNGMVAIAVKYIEPKSRCL